MRKLIALIGLFILVMAVGVTATLSDGLIAHYNMDSSSGGEPNEVTAYPGLDLSDYGSCSNVAGKIDTARSDFSLSDVLYDTSWETNLSQESDSTICYWVKIDDFSQITVHLSTGHIGGNEGYFSELFYITTDGHIQFQITHNGDAGVDTPYATISDNNWHFICGVYDGDNRNGTLYVDSAEIGSAVLTASVGLTPDGIGIGVRDDFLYPALNTSIDQVDFWGRELTPAEIIQLYNSGAGMGYPYTTPDLTSGLISYWKLDESSGDAIDSMGINNATQIGTVNSTNGIINTGRGNFDVTNFLAVYNASGLPQSENSDFSMGAWFMQVEDIPGYDAHIINFGDLATQADYLIGRITVDTNNVLYDIIKDRVAGNSYKTTFNNTLGTWIFVTMTYDGATKNMSAYYNGELVGSAIFEQSGCSAPTDLWIGQRWLQDANASGLWVDEAFLYDRVLSSSDISDLYNSGAGWSYPFIEEQIPEPPTDPYNFLNTGGDWGTFPYIYDKELMWNASTSTRSNISYECRMVSYGVIGCDNFQPPDDVVYDFEYTNDDGASWHIADSGAYDYQGFGGFTTWNETGWATYTTLMFKTEDFPNGDLRMRIRAFDGYLYSNWVESNNFTNYPSNWSCIAYNNQSCSEGYYDCTEATDLNQVRSDMGWQWNFGEFLTHLNNKTACALPCTPDWACDGYGNCTQNNTQPCNSVIDNNFCGESYGGNYSEFTPQSCSWTPTGYVALYGSGDLGKLTIDTFGRALLAILSMVGVIVVIGVVTFGMKKLKGIKR